MRRLRERPAARQALVLGLTMALTIAAVLVGQAVLRRQAGGPPVAAPQGPGGDGSKPAANVPGAEVAPGGARAPAALGASGGAGPGRQVVVGRVVDRESGLAVRDAGITVLELGRRSITLPDGRFRLDGVPAGAYTLVVGPAEGYVPRSLDLRVLPDGADVGIVGLLPGAAPVLVDAESGGTLAGCEGGGGQGTRIEIEPGALLESLAIELSCLERGEDLPAPAPAGRLPLSAADIAPGDVALIRPGGLTIGLPDQPRYAEGVTLDLLRLDLDRLVWRTVGVLEVGPEGRTATGELLAFGTYMAAAPPFGAFSGSAAPGEPKLLRYGTALKPGGGAQDLVPTGTELVYLGLDYAGMADAPLELRTLSEDEELLFETELRLDGRGHLDVPMAGPDGPWPVGRYNTTFYLGEPPTIHSLSWAVGSPTAEPPPPAFVGPSLAQAADAPAPAVWAAPAACSPPAAWWAYQVQPGDTLSALAARTGSSVAALQSANCLGGDGIRAGQGLYLPTIAYRVKPPALPADGGYGQLWPKPNPAAPRPSPWLGGGSGPGAGAPPMATAMPYIKPTRPPDPTLAPRPQPPAGAFPDLSGPQLPPSGPRPGSQGLSQPPPQPPQPDPGAGSGSVKEPRGADPTLAPRPVFPAP